MARGCSVPLGSAAFLGAAAAAGLVTASLHRRWLVAHWRAVLPAAAVAVTAVLAVGGALGMGGRHWPGTKPGRRRPGWRRHPLPLEVMRCRPTWPSCTTSRAGGPRPRPGRTWTRHRNMEPDVTDGRLVDMDPGAVPGSTHLWTSGPGPAAGPRDHPHPPGAGRRRSLLRLLPVIARLRRPCPGHDAGRHRPGRRGRRRGHGPGLPALVPGGGDGQPGGMGVPGRPQLGVLVAAASAPGAATYGRNRRGRYRAHRRTTVARALADLDVRQRAVVVCRYLLGWSEAETAAALGTPVGTVKSRLHRASRLLAARLSHLRPEDDQ